MSLGGRIPKRDLTGFFRVIPLGWAVAVAGLLPRRALIPIVALTGELVGVLVGEDVLDLLGECLRGLGRKRGYKVGRVSSRFLRASL